MQQGSQLEDMQQEKHQGPRTLTCPFETLRRGPWLTHGKTKMYTKDIKNPTKTRFQRTWFYPANQRRPHSGYQTMSTIKRTLRHSRMGGRKGIQGGEKWGFTERFQRFKRYILRILRAQQRRGKKRGTKQERAKEWEFVPYP